MKYLDYNRLSQNDVDPQIRSFLLQVCRSDSIRRAQVAHPEFFCEEICQHTIIQRSDVALRSKALDSDESANCEDAVIDAAKWFGLTVYTWEGRTDGNQQVDCELLPADFALEKDEFYNGLTDQEPWIIELTPDGQPHPSKHIVLNILHVGDQNPEFFFHSIALSSVSV